MAIFLKKELTRVRLGSICEIYSQSRKLQL